MSIHDQFAETLIEEVNAKCEVATEEISREQAFTELILGRLNDYNEVDSYELCAYEAKSSGSTPAAKISAWEISGDGATLDLFVSQYAGVLPSRELGKPDAKRAFDLGRGFLKRALDGFHHKLAEADDARPAMEQIHDSRDSLSIVRIFFLTDCALRSMDIEEASVNGLEVRYIAWDLDKLCRIHSGDREMIEVDLANDYGGAIPCIESQDPTGEYRTFLAFLPADLLSRIYGSFGQRLLEKNVRAFLQAKGKVNKGLQKTIKTEPARFLAYNNGLCCTAADVKIRSGQGNHVWLESIRDFQIVNGAQTTASIFHALKKERVDISQITVQMKLTVLRNAAEIDQLVSLISQYANSQNKVNAADFNANGPFHRSLEELSRSVPAPAIGGLDRMHYWYYERARGSYADDKARQGTKAKMQEWEKRNPVKQKFTKTDLAKYENAYSGHPQLACLGAEKNFMKFAERMEKQGAPVVDQLYFRRLIAKAILFKTAEDLFTSSDLQAYRAQSVAYAVAWIAEKSERRLDLDGIWRQQRLGVALHDVVQIVVRAAHAHIVAQTGNLSENAKKEWCWAEFRHAELDLPSAWLDELLDQALNADRSEDQYLAEEWERVRLPFVSDERDLRYLEILTRKLWVRSRRDDKISWYARHDWATICQKSGFGQSKRRGLVELFSAAHEALVPQE